MNRLAILLEKPKPPQRDGTERKPLLGFPALCLVQGAYYLALALWPLGNPVALEASAGLRTDDLPARTLWLFLVVDAALLLVAAWRRQAATEVAVVAMGSTLALTALDGLHLLLRAPAPVYLLDVAVEVFLLGAWVRLLAPEQHGGARAAVGLPKDLHELPH